MYNYQKYYYIRLKVEKWKIIKYRDIVPDYYEVSNIGRVRRHNDQHILKGEDPKYERCGYKRYGLKTLSGKVKKFQVHRLVLCMFGKFDDSLEVNHKDGNKLNNYIENLECVTPNENKYHAKINNLYQSCEDHYKSIFTNNEVELICKYLQNGMPISEVIKEMHLEQYPNIYSNIMKIINKKSWVRISKKYIFDRKLYHYKTYPYEVVDAVCKYIFIDGLKNTEIVEKFPQFDKHNFTSMVKSIRAKRLYKDVSDNYTTFND